MEVPADVTDAFDVLFVFGLAAILDDHRDGVRIRWVDRRTAVVDAGLDDDAVGEVVREHARTRSEGSWITEVIDLDGKVRAPLSPRIGLPASAESWEHLERERERVIDAIPAEPRLDRRLVGALGRPAHWAHSADGLRVDYGSSAWEMKTRNRGEEFLQNRMSLLAQSLASRAEIDVVKGLRGAVLRDEVGKDALDSRTPTGLRAPGPADNARALCALWGISLFPVRPVVSINPYQPAPSRTSGVVRTERWRRWFAVPVPDDAVTVGRLRAATRSAALTGVVTALVEEGASRAARGRREAQWLQRHGFAGVSVFEQYRSDNVNAPELWLGPGRYVSADDIARARSSGRT